MKKAMHFVIAGVLAAGLGVVGVGPAQAAEGCSLGYACLWEHWNYNNGTDGKVWGNSLNKGTFGGLFNPGTAYGWYDIASSAWANGKQCKYTNWYVDPNSKGNNFRLNSQYRVGYTYKDSYLGDGAGGTKLNFNDNISSYEFFGCN